MSSLSLDDVLTIARDLSTKANPNWLSDDDITISRYAQMAHIGATDAKIELEELEKSGFLSSRIKTPQYGGKTVIAYRVVEKRPRSLIEAIEAIDDYMASFREGNPEWLQENDLTAQRYAEKYGLSESWAYMKLRALKKDGFFTKKLVRARHVKGGIAVWRPTKKLLDLQKKEAKPKRRKR
jgi:hypothetical protein